MGKWKLILGAEKEGCSPQCCLGQKQNPLISPSITSAHWEPQENMGDQFLCQDFPLLCWFQADIQQCFCDQPTLCILILLTVEFPLVVTLSTTFRTLSVVKLHSLH